MLSPTGKNVDDGNGLVEEIELYHLIVAPLWYEIVISLDWICTPGHINWTDSPVGAAGVTTTVPSICLEFGLWALLVCPIVFCWFALTKFQSKL